MNKGAVDQGKVSVAVRKMTDLMNELGMSIEEKVAAAEAIACSAREVAMSSNVDINTGDKQ